MYLLVPRTYFSTVGHGFNKTKYASLNVDTVHHALQQFSLWNELASKVTSVPLYTTVECVPGTQCPLDPISSLAA